MILLMILRSFKDSLLEVASLDPASHTVRSSKVLTPRVHLNLRKSFLFPRLRRFRPRFICFNTNDTHTHTHTKIENTKMYRQLGNGMV
jgi:hypothetical protein